MFKVKEIEAKTSPRKKSLDLKNISVENLKLIDTDTGENITEQVIAEIPTGIETVDFKLTFEIPDDEDDDEE
jgi:hypothetical protein